MCFEHVHSANVIGIQADGAFKFVLLAIRSSEDPCYQGLVVSFFFFFFKKTGLLITETAHTPHVKN